jgi:hypothetical protein
MKLGDNLRAALRQHACKGGKTSRRRQVDRIQQFLKFCATNGVRAPEQIGKRHVHEWFEESHLSESTLRDRFYAVSLLWEWMGRGQPPKPRNPVISNAKKDLLQHDQPSIIFQEQPLDSGFSSGSVD